MAFMGFNKGANNKADLENLLADISCLLEPQEMEIMVTRGRNCEVLFANAKADARMNDGRDHDGRCKSGFAGDFTNLCDNCPNGGRQKEAGTEPFEIEDTGGRSYIVRCNTVNWIDGKPASIFVLRDVTPEKEATERLYNLAYVDQLTEVPNRQKLKEDFAAIEEELKREAVSGIIAIFDLDHFKAINDTYGHNTGDVVLRRLTEHLSGESTFSGHLYRLGGDEFVLLYSDAPDRFDTEEEMIKHYKDMLSTALRAYTLPTIDVKCTLSMGVSLFPKHGANLSEILRKADIALYKSKAAGRNQISFFEDQHDTAQRFRDLFINIQPVLLGAGKTFGYELIDSGTNSDDDDKTVTLNEFNRTLDALGLHDLENDLHYFITFSKQLLNPAVATNLPKEKFIVQMNVPPKMSRTDLLKDIQTFNDLRANGYKLALTGLNSGSSLPDLLSFADYCKFSPADGNLNRQKAVIATNKNVKFIATKVDSPNAFRDAKEAGFHMFQGYYFNQPVVGKKTKEISPLKVNYFRLLKLSSTGDYLDFREISSIIASDVALSYKLLRILNSAAVGLRNVSSIENAVAYMGEENLKKWIAVLALRGIADDKPLELVRMSLIRARFGELLAPHFLVKRDPQHVFMVGMLSLLHIALEKTREQLLEEIPVADDIRQSLLTKNGVYSDLLLFYENYEYANWDTVSQFVEQNNLDPSYVNEAYVSSIKWYHDLADT